MLAGVMHVWRDPQSGTTYVVNGHNRVAKALELGVPEINVMHIDAATPEEARTQGALINISEGHGTPVDAAKLFRDSGLTPAALQEMGVPLRGDVARKGLALAGLHSTLFDRVATGRMDEGIGAVIGRELAGKPELQIQLARRIEGRDLTQRVVSELAQEMASAPTEHAQTESLFGTTDVEQSLAFEKAKLKAEIAGRLAQEKRTFGALASSKKAEELARGGNEINVAGNAEIARTAAQNLEVFDALKNTPEINSIFNKAAKGYAHAKGEAKKKLVSDIYAEVFDKLNELAGRADAESRVVPEETLFSADVTTKDGTPVEGPKIMGPVDSPMNGHTEQSLDEAARALDDQARNGAGDTPVLNMAVFGLDQKTAERVGRMVSNVPNEVVERGSAAKQKFQRLMYSMRRMFNPAANASIVGRNAITGALGARRRSYVEASLQFDAVERAINKLYSQGDQVKMLLALDQGTPIDNPNLQAFADEMKKDYRDVANTLSAYDLLHTHRINYVPRIYRVIPKSMREKFTSEEHATASAHAHAPFLGSKFFLKHREYDKLSDALADGGQLISNNFVTLYKFWKAHTSKLLSGIEMSERSKRDGVAVFVPHDAGEKLPTSLAVYRSDVAPKDFVRLDLGDKNFFLKPEEKRPDLGEWYMERGSYDLLKNHMSRDMIRDSILGHSLIRAKDFQVSIRLAGPFHMAFTAGMATDFGIARTLRRISEAGRAALSGNFSEAGARAAEAVRKAPGEAASMIRDVRTGVALREYLRARDKQAFLASDMGRYIAGVLDREAPGMDIDRMVDLMFHAGVAPVGGGDTQGHVRALQEAWRQERLLGTVSELPQAAAEMIAKPIMEWQVPLTKASVFVREFSLRLLENRDKLLLGQTTEEEIARDTGRYVENVAGQLAYDFNFFPRTVKSFAQLLITAPGWKLGNIRMIQGGLKPQRLEIMSALKEHRLPRLDPRVAWGLATALRTMATSGALTYMFVGHLPDNMIDWFYPVRSEDAEGNKKHFSPLSYVADWVGFKRDPIEYMLASLSPIGSRGAEAYKNSDYHGHPIYFADDKTPTRWARAVEHVFLPDNIFIRNYVEGVKRKGGDPTNPLDPSNLAVLAFAASGLGRPAPAYIEETPMQQYVRDYYAHNHHIEFPTEEDNARSVLHAQILSEARATGNIHEAQKRIADALRNRSISPREAQRMMTEVRQDQTTEQFKGLPIDVALEAFKRASPEERRKTVQQLQAKYNRIDVSAMTPEEFRSIRDAYREALRLPRNHRPRMGASVAQVTK